MTYTYRMARRDSDRTIIGYWRRREHLPDIDSAALAESLRTLVEVWSVMAAVSLSSVALVIQATA